MSRHLSSTWTKTAPFKWVYGYRWSVGVRQRVDESPVAGHLGDFKFVDAPAGHFYADPFIIEHEGRVLLFFEDYNFLTRSANVGCAGLDRTGNVVERRTVLQRPYHLSYPHVFPFEGKYYMIPETASANRVELYRAVAFPWEWRLEKVLFSGVKLYDATCVPLENKWWLFAGGSSTGSPGHYDELHVFHAPTIMDEFKPHACNPVKTDLSSARPAGAVIVDDEQLIRPAQNCSRWYGDNLTLMRIDALSESAYSEQPFRDLPESWQAGSNLGIHTYNVSRHFEVIDVCLYGLEPAALIGRALSLPKICIAQLPGLPSHPASARGGGHGLRNCRPPARQDSPQERRITPWARFLLYVRTARHLEPVQIYARFRPHPRFAKGGALSRRKVTGAWVPAIPKPCCQTGPNRFRFLNQEREIASWNDGSASKLWLYNLHYFEHAGSVLVERWIAENPAGQGIGWDPYPTSLRIANWCKWILGGASPSQAVAASLCTQARWLEKRLERHLLANHLLANAKGLLFAGMVFVGQEAERWRAKGIRILSEELPRQILADGAHVERSPMYHGIVLEDLLDICNLRHAFGGTVPDLSRYACRMLGWLHRMMHPDSRISFFNDAALGIASDWDALVRYAERLRIYPETVELGESGYRRLDNGKMVLIFDAAPLGPEYQPGHGHADLLSFEASVEGRRVLVNSGTSTYEAGAVRSFEVGTAAHNTIRVDGVDQSEMWGAFRVARRGKPLDLRTDHRSFVEAAHDGYHRLRPKVTHRRRVELAGESLLITDWLEGQGTHQVELFLHIAPNANPRIALDARMTRQEFASTYRVGFNAEVPNRTVIGHWTGACPVRFETRIDLCEPSDNVTVPV